MNFQLKDALANADNIRRMAQLSQDVSVKPMISFPPPKRKNRKTLIHFVVVRPDMATNKYQAEVFCNKRRWFNGVRRTEDWAHVDCPECLKLKPENL